MPKSKHNQYLERTQDRIDDAKWAFVERGVTAPPLVNGVMMLTDAGIALAAWLEASGIPIPEMPAPKGSLIKPAARWFASLSPLEAAGLWTEYQNSMHTG